MPKQIQEYRRSFRPFIRTSDIRHYTSSRTLPSAGVTSAAVDLSPPSITCTTRLFYLVESYTMTVLRSRDTLSAVSAKSSKPMAVENRLLEPRTPLKTLDYVAQLSNSTSPVSGSLDLASGPPLSLESGAGTFMYSDSGNVRRRSARLTKNLGILECSESVGVVNGKRKKVEFEVEGNSSSDESDGNLGRKVLDFELGVDKSGGLPGSSMTGLCFQNLDDGLDKLVADKEEASNVGGASKLGLGNDLRAGEIDTLNNKKRQKKLCVDSKISGLKLIGKDEVGEQFLTLRSGKNAVKRGIKTDTSAGNLLGGTRSGKQSGIELGCNIVKTRSRASLKEVNNDGCMEQKVTRANNGKGKAGRQTSVIGDTLSLNLKDGVNADKTAVGSETVKKTRGGENKAEKGKMKLVDNNFVYDDISISNLQMEDVHERNFSDTIHHEENAAALDESPGKEADVGPSDGRRVYRERFRNVARRNASRFAHFSAHDELGNRSNDAERRQIPLSEADSGTYDWPGPFSTAMKIIKDRRTKEKEWQHVTSTAKTESAELTWVPRNLENFNCHKNLAPSLHDLCLQILAKNADAITSLECVPDVVRHKICWFLCDHRKMDSHFLELLVCESPTEICLKDCSWLSEELFSKIFESCNTSKLTVLQLDHCGVCMPDYVLPATFAHSPNSLPALTSVSLKGAYRLSDTGLSSLVSSGPSLKSVDLSQCPLVTAEGILCLSNSLRSVLRELYIDHCQGVDAMVSLPGLLELENLEVLSVAGIHTVCDDFVCEVVSVHGCRLKHLGLADCIELTDYSLEVIGNTCTGLRAIDLSNLCNLTDVAIGHLANGCKEVHMLRFCRNAFSDEAIAAYIDIRGTSLKDLSLNNVIKVSNNTALSVSRNCKNLLTLDLSWCRNMTNEALGLIVDSCSSLEILKLFGCTQVTNLFLEGHSNPRVELIGLKMTPLFKHINVPDFQQGPLRS
ncbi:hypothetical protein F511_35156 [Dorcoceras hygrometricum]|uniref:Uncharacterized protein n=1 Tax=Dorcoceras hygrometricum TaxID=472368 RepID=A0A2Z7DF15_9LAMI|nr:hypothetical protein F511_35156 [Dorcoceras hygrometricum]